MTSTVPTSTRARTGPLIAALLFAVTLALYWRTGDFAFLNYDDDAYVTANPEVLGGLSPSGLRWAFTSGHAANWHPLTWISHQLDVTCFGPDAGAHHRTSAVLHALAAGLCFLALHALTGALAPSVLVAALFALHPLRAESVAWVAERKDVLSGVLALGVLWSYAGWTRRGGAGRLARTALLLALGLMAKPMLVTLPFVLLLLDVWPLDRARGAWRDRIREKIPLFALAGVSSLVTYLVQREGGAVLAAIEPGARVANAIRALAIYATKILWPRSIAVIVPHPALVPEPDPGLGLTTALALLGLLVVALGAWRLRRRAPALAVGLAWYAGMLVPVVGLVQVGVQAWAARYTYLPSIGFTVALVFGLGALLPPRARRAGGVALGLGLIPLTWATARQIDTWRSSRTLFEHALRVTDQNEIAHTNLGQALESEGDVEGAREQYEAALSLRPGLTPVRASLARVLLRLGQRARARAALEQVVREAPDEAGAQADLGWLDHEEGRDREALEHLRRAVALAPGDLLTRNRLAWALATGDDATRAREALELAQGLVAATAGRQAGFLETLAAALARLGRFEEAVAAQSEALARVPEDARPLLRERLRLYREGRAYVRAIPTR